MKRLFSILILTACAMAQGTLGGTGQGSGTGQMGILPLPTQFVLTVTITGFGTVTGSPNGAGNIPLICPGTCAVSFPSGTPVTLTETPGGGQTFSTWGGACGGSATTCVLTITANTSVSATWTGAGSPGCSGGFCAQEPTSWQDPTICNPTGGVYDTTVTLGTTNNIGPNVAGGAIGVPYALSINGLLDAMNNWRDNADNASQTPHFSDKWWLIKIPAGTVLHGSTYDANTSLISLPGKMNAGVEATKCLVLDSTTPLPSYTMTGAVTSGVFTNGERVRQGTSLAEATLYNAVTGATPMQLGPMSGYPDQASMFTWVGQTSGAVYTPTSTPNRFMVCDRGNPGFDGTRNPGCDGHVAGPNDQASLWKIQMDASGLAVGKAAVHSGTDLVTPTNYTNHIVRRNYEITVAPGASQSKAGSPAPILDQAKSGSSGTFVFGVGPTLLPVAKHVGIENYYLHGWDPGDAGQPGAGSGNAAVDPVTGACLSWNNSGYVTVAPDGGGVNSTVTWQALFSSTINTYFGMTFKPGSIINIGGTNYTIANTTLTQNVLNGLANTTLSIVGTVTIATNTLYTQQNPPAQYAVGCGDDVHSALQFAADYSWREGGKIEKIHHWGSESHVSSQGFEPVGVLKDVRNSEEGGSGGWFEGGSPLDTEGGPGADFEIRRNYFGRDLNWRTLSATATGSPAPPFGCGVIPSDNGGHPVASHNTCPFNWAIKNPMENKMAVRNLVDGDIIEDSWSDGQSGFCVLRNVETNSGGATGGGFDVGTGLPKTVIRDVRTSNTWVRNCAQPIQMDNRSAGQTQAGSNGGGVSQAESNMDYINDLWTNIADSAQFGKVGTGQWQWTAGGEDFPCTMSYVGSVAPFTVTATCQPAQVGMHGWVTKISKDASNVVTVSKVQRTDPYLCLTTPSDCVAKGYTLIMTGAPGWNGTFAMSGTDTNWFADGTGGSDVIYTDNINPVSGAAVLCDNAVSTNKCSANPYVMTVASLAMKMTDIAVGDGVRAFDVGGGDTTCTTNGFAAGTNSSVVAFTGTLQLGLTVVYQINTQPSQLTANCMVSNRVGIPKNMVVRNNTFLSPNYMAITAFANWYQSINNTFNDNVFISNDSGNHSHMYCTGKGGGAGSLVCWDLNTLKFYHNVMPQANSANWTGAVYNCPSGACINSFPATVNCPTATADATCVGYSGFMGGSPAVTYPTGSCPAANAPFNCPLMALPWANNLTIDNLSYVGSSLFSTQGVDITAMKNAFNRTKYVCTGACGDGSAGHHPYPD